MDLILHCKKGDLENHLRHIVELGSVLPCNDSDVNVTPPPRCVCSVCLSEFSEDTQAFKSSSVILATFSRVTLNEKLNSILKTDTFSTASGETDAHFVCRRCATLLELCDRLEGRLREVADFIRTVFDDARRQYVDDYLSSPMGVDSSDPIAASPLLEDVKPPSPLKEALKKKFGRRPSKKAQKDVEIRPRITRCGARIGKKENLKLEADSSAVEVSSDSVGSLECDRCKKTFSSAKEAKMHNDLHCKLCGFWTHKKRYLVKHMNRHSQTPDEFPYECRFCAKKFRVKETMEFHENKVHLEVAPYLCEDCGKGFYNRTALRVHAKSKGAPEPATRDFRCEDCKRTFKDPLRYQNHIAKGCAGQRPYICERCGKSYASKYLLQIHVTAVHMKMRPHACTECDQTFGVRSALRKHIQTVHTEFHLTCEDCDAKFKTGTGLKNHAWQVHNKEVGGVRIRECPDCNRTFTTKQKFEDHCNLHKGLKPHKCPLCTYSCTLKGNLGKHIRNVHKAEPKAVLLEVSENSEDFVTVVGPRPEGQIPALRPLKSSSEAGNQDEVAILLSAVDFGPDIPDSDVSAADTSPHS